MCTATSRRPFFASFRTLQSDTARVDGFIAINAQPTAAAAAWRSAPPPARVDGFIAINAQPAAARRRELHTSPVREGTSRETLGVLTTWVPATAMLLLRIVRHLPSCHRRRKRSRNPAFLGQLRSGVSPTTVKAIYFSCSPQHHKLTVDVTVTAHGIGPSA